MRTTIRPVDWASMKAPLFVAWVGLSLSFWSCGSLESARSGSEGPQTAGAVSEEELSLNTIEGTLARAYDVISGAQGEVRDWQRFHDLFLPGRGMLQAVYRDAEGQARVRHITPEEYATMAQGLFDQEGFYETGLHHRSERFGSIAHVFSTYESRRDPSGEPFARGINSFQLFWDGERWYVISILWDQEYSDQSIPRRYLPSGSR